MDITNKYKFTKQENRLVCLASLLSTMNYTEEEKNIYYVILATRIHQELPISIVRKPNMKYRYYYQLYNKYSNEEEIKSIIYDICNRFKESTILYYREHLHVSKLVLNKVNNPAIYDSYEYLIKSMNLRGETNVN